MIALLALVPPWIRMAAIWAVVSGVLVSAAYVKGRMDSSANCKEASLQRVIDSLRRDKQNQEAAAFAEEILRNKLEKENTELEGNLQEYIDELQSTDDCTLDDNDVKRLRKLGSI